MNNPQAVKGSSVKGAAAAPSSESERRTRKSRIDPKLKASGWQFEPFDPTRPLSKYSGHAIEEYPTTNGPADYGLVVDGQLLGVVEAKKVTLGPQNVLTQAERYSKGIDASPLNFRGYRVPFLYSTNGEVLWFHDVRDKLNRSRKIAGFHMRDALREMLARDLNAQCGWFTAHADLHPSWFRPYQIEACTAIEEAIANRKRQMLVAMATGTAKTWTLVNEVYRLLESGVGKRILFLVDRRALAAQAVRTFTSFEPEPAPVLLDRIATGNGSRISGAPAATKSRGSQMRTKRTSPPVGGSSSRRRQHDVAR
jgi:type I restriction enzyme, R subunit